MDLTKIQLACERRDKKKREGNIGEESEKEQNKKKKVRRIARAAEREKRTEGTNAIMLSCSFLFKLCPLHEPNT